MVICKLSIQGGKLMRTVDCYDLLTRDQREQIADIMMEAMSFYNKFLKQNKGILL